jgi:hypothetical protein
MLYLQINREHYKDAGQIQSMNSPLKVRPANLYHYHKILGRLTELFYLPWCASEIKTAYLLPGLGVSLILLWISSSKDKFNNENNNETDRPAEKNTLTKTKELVCGMDPMRKLQTRPLL